MPRLVVGLDRVLVHVDDRRVADAARLVRGAAVLVRLAVRLRDRAEGVALARHLRLRGWLLLLRLRGLLIEDDRTADVGRTESGGANAEAAATSAATARNRNIGEGGDGDALVKPFDSSSRESQIASNLT